MSNVIDPLELLTNKGNRKPSFLNKLWNPMLGATSGFVCACFINFGFRKPVFSGIQKHVGFTALGGIIGKVVDGKRNEYIAKRDAVLRHYVQLHPDDFPPIERKKYGEILESWVPIR